MGVVERDPLRHRLRRRHLPLRGRNSGTPRQRPFNYCFLWQTASMLFPSGSSTNAP